MVRGILIIAVLSAWLLPPGPAQHWALHGIGRVRRLPQSHPDAAVFRNSGRPSLQRFSQALPSTAQSPLLGGSALLSVPCRWLSVYHISFRGRRQCPNVALKPVRKSERSLFFVQRNFRHYRVLIRFGKNHSLTVVALKVIPDST